MEYRKFTRKSELDKAFNVLKGMLDGISADNKIEKSEIGEIYFWLKNQSETISLSPFDEIMKILARRYNDNSFDRETLDDLNWICHQFLETNIYFNGTTADLQTLHGFCHGILADGVVNDIEIDQLKNWLEQHKHLSTYYPYDEIYAIVINILEDGIVSEAERAELTILLNDFVELASENALKVLGNTINVDSKISGVISKVLNLNLLEKTFCFTGESSRMTRKQIEEFINENGGNFSNTVTKKVDYLIIGSAGNPCWAYSCYGRKVEQAINLRKKGQNIMIISEDNLWAEY